MNNTDLFNKVTVLISGCKAYSDVLHNFEILFEKNWPDCPFRIYLNIDEPIDGLKISYDKIIVSNHKQNLIRMRDVIIETPYVIMLQDDHFIFDRVNNSLLAKYIELAEKYDCGNLRLIQDPKTEDVFNETEGLLIYKPGKAYRISARGGLWKTEYWKKFVDKYDDFWEMEQQGQVFSSSLPEMVLCTKYRILPIFDAVHKGYYEDFAVMLLEANEISPCRPVAPGLIKFKETIKAIIWETNPDLIAKLQNYLGFGHKQKYK